MSQRPVQLVRNQGWTPETIRRACATLVQSIAASDDEDGELAAEFLRFVRNACDDDPDGIVNALTEWTPSSPDTPQWDALYALLADPHVDADVVTELENRYPDLVKVLIAFADEVVPEPQMHNRHQPGQSEKLETAHRHVFVALLLLDTDESVDYVLTHLRKFDWSDASLDWTREDEKLFDSCQDVVQTVTLRLWPTLSWGARADLVCFLTAHDLIREHLFWLLIDTNIETLSSSDLESYIDGLWFLLDDRCIPRVQAILERALDHAEGGDVTAERIVNLMVSRFGERDLSSWRTEEQLQRARRWKPTVN